MILGSGWVDVPMDSLEIMEFINKHKKYENGKTTHTNLLQKIRKMFTEKELGHGYYTHWQNGQIYKKYLLTVEQSNILIHSYLSATKLHSREMEYAVLVAIETILGIKLERQYSVITTNETFRIDGYHKETNTAYEVDEPYHSGNKEADDRREKLIKDVMGCEFVRIKL